MQWFPSSLKVNYINNTVHNKETAICIVYRHLYKKLVINKKQFMYIIRQHSIMIIYKVKWLGDIV